MCGGEKGERGRRHTGMPDGVQRDGVEKLELNIQIPKPTPLWTFPAWLCSQMLYLSSGSDQSNSYKMTLLASPVVPGARRRWLVDIKATSGMLCKVDVALRSIKLGVGRTK